MRKLFFSFGLILACAGAMCLTGSITQPHFKSAHAQLAMTGAGAGAPSGGGVTPATFTAESTALSPSGGQTSSPYTISGVAFNTGASDVPVFEFINQGDLGGTITGMTFGGNSATCQIGTNNAAEQAGICYASPVSLGASVNVVVSFTGSKINMAGMSAKITTTTPIPISFGGSNSSQGGSVSTPLAEYATGSPTGIPTNGVGACMFGDFFTAGSRNWTSLTPIQDAIINDTTDNQASLGAGHSTTAGSTSGVSANSNGSGSVFPAWMCVSWSP